MSDSHDSSDSLAFERLYQEEGSSVRRFLRMWLRNDAGADEVLQETDHSVVDLKLTFIGK